LTLLPDQTAEVGAVAPGSLAASAGFAPGDRIVSIEDQPLISIADVSWVLNQAPVAGALNAVVDRNGTREKLTLFLPDGWRSKTDISRRVGTWPMRGMATGGLVSEDLADEERQRRGLHKTGLALFVKHVGEYGEHAAAKKAGFQKDDVIVQIGDMQDRLTESELIGRILTRYSRGEKLPAVVLRGDQRVELMLPVQ
jgi:S1-C subfamily serine protease